MDTDKDIKLAIGWNRKVLGFVGIWPEPISEDRTSIYRFVIATVVIVTFVSGPQCINLFLLNGNLALITENLCMANIPMTVSVLKLLFTWYHREVKKTLSMFQDLKRIVKAFYDDWHCMKTEEERTTMLNSAKVARYISIWCTVLTQTMITAFLSLRIVTVATCDRDKENQDRLLIYPGYFPYSLHPILSQVLTNLPQVSVAYFSTCSYTGVDSFIAMLVLHTCGQFKNLSRRLERLMDKKDGTKSVHQIEEELVWIVKRHEHLNWMAIEIDNSFNILLLIQMLFCTIQICCQGFIIFSVILPSDEGAFSFSFFFFVLFIVFIVVHIYLYCYVGEMLLIQSGGMSYSAYNTNWFNVSPREARCLLFIMHRCSRPLCLSAGKFGVFSMELFSAILKTAVGYLSVLLTVSNDN